ncbi:MAG: hypothetical protein Q4F74_02425 [Synergistaceae bacterium]|nr:hypothetical protein [Synergistaceae bacterium]
MNNIIFTELTPQFDSRISFYGKAHLLLHDNGKIQLQSYATIVAEKTPDGEIKVFGRYSATTSRHVKEFIKQITGKSLTSKEIERRYF